MADILIRLPFQIVQAAASDAGKIEYPLMTLTDNGDGTYTLPLSSGAASKKIRSPWPAANDPTNYPLLGLVDEGDGTYALRVVFV